MQYLVIHKPCSFLFSAANTHQGPCNGHPGAPGYRDGHNAALHPGESGPRAGTKAKAATVRGTHLGQCGLQGLGDHEDEQLFVGWDVTNVNTAGALSGPIKQVSLSSQHPW